MSRELDPAVCLSNSSQLLIGLDGISLIAANPLGGDSTGEGCSDSISGGKTLTGIRKADGVTPCNATDGCSPAGSYTFADWRDVLAMVYGGLNHNTAIAPIFAADSGTCEYVAPNIEATGDGPCQSTGQVCFPSNRCGVAGLVGHRNPARVNCISPVRQALVDSWGTLFSDTNVGQRCRSGGCTTLHRAFRLDDLSGTTDIFASLIGLPPVPPFTRAVANNSPMPDRAATANPFCNAGSRVMNKGDADYLDLDPIRRAVDHEHQPTGNRFGLEQVGELLPAFGGNNNDSNCMLGAIPEDHGSPTAPGIWPDPNIANSEALLQADLGFDPVQQRLLLVPYGPTTRLCLGLVFPISFPTNYNPLPTSSGFADWAPTSKTSAGSRYPATLSIRQASARRSRSTRSS
jgi:hypothetical protein